jgi:hypothetical protein
MVKNEEDIIEPFVRHNLAFLDMLIVADNASSDRTRTILELLGREGLPVAVFDDPVAAFSQSAKTTRMLASVSAALSPDYVVPLDADEFIRCASKDLFLQALRTIPPGGIGLVPWMTYVVTPKSSGESGLDPPRSMTFRRREERPQYSKVMVRMDGRHDPRLSLEPGNHGVRRTDGAAVPEVRVEGVALGHFPVRSADQLVCNAVIGWMGYLAWRRDIRDSGMGYQKRDIFDVVTTGGQIRSEELPRRSMLYAQEEREIDWETDVVDDPMDFVYQRRHSSGERSLALSAIVKAWEASVSPNDCVPRPLEAALESAASRYAGDEYEVS